MASQQTIKMSAEMPQFKAAFENADTGRKWHVRISYAASIAEISSDNSKPLAGKDSAAHAYKSRTEALIASAKAAKASAEKAGIVAKEGHNGGYGCWKTKDGAKRNCWLFAYPAPIDAAELPADKPAKAAGKPADKPQAEKPAIAPKAADKPQESASAARRRIANEQAKQKIAADMASAEASKPAADAQAAQDGEAIQA